MQSMPACDPVGRQLKIGAVMFQGLLARLLEERFVVLVVWSAHRFNAGQKETIEDHEFCPFKVGRQLEAAAKSKVSAT